MQIHSLYTLTQYTVDPESNVDDVAMLELSFVLTDYDLISLVIFRKYCRVHTYFLNNPTTAA